MFTITVNYGALTSLNLQVKKMPQAVAEVLRAVTSLVDKEVKEQIQKIYDRPIPVRPRTGRPMWVRTGDLMNGRLQIIVVSGREAQIDIKGRAEAYALRRHELGVSWMPKRPALGIIRRNPFMTDAIKNVEPQIQPLVDAVFAEQIGLSK